MGAFGKHIFGVKEVCVCGLQNAEKDQIKDRVKAETIKALLAVVDSFEMAKGTLKPESEGEQKIDSAYQVCAGCPSSLLAAVGSADVKLACCSPLYMSVPNQTGMAAPKLSSQDPV